jgi:poly(3-hydroxyoctanoate) depolymerase
MMSKQALVIVATVLPMACEAEPEGRDDLGAAYDPAADGEDGEDADAGDGPADDPVALPVVASVCTVGYGTLDCHATSTTFDVDGLTREVLWKVPAGTPPPGGWPVVLAFQGTNDPADKFFDYWYWSAIDNAYGGYYQTKTVQGLLDAGFAVLAPKARLRVGGTYWDTNVAPYALDWDSAPDGALVERLFDEIAAGTFGPLDPDLKYAMGLSSGGYMASRLAVEYPGEIQAIALQSASYATCISSLPCTVTDANLPEEHAPTLLMAGYWDAIVPLYTIDAYADALEDNGTPVDLHVVGSASHQWTSSSPGWVLGWFEAY